MFSHGKPDIFATDSILKWRNTLTEEESSD